MRGGILARGEVYHETRPKVKKEKKKEEVDEIDISPTGNQNTGAAHQAQKLLLIELQLFSSELVPTLLTVLFPGHLSRLRT
jgi:hypothetical protein